MRDSFRKIALDAVAALPDREDLRLRLEHLTTTGGALRRVFAGLRAQQEFEFWWEQEFPTRGPVFDIVRGLEAAAERAGVGVNTFRCYISRGGGKFTRNINGVPTTITRMR